MVQLIVTMNDKGQVSVTGPIDQLLLCCGLLEIAKVQLFKHVEQMQQQIQPPTPAELLKLGQPS